MLAVQRDDVGAPRRRETMARRPKGIQMNVPDDETGLEDTIARMGTTMVTGGVAISQRSSNLQGGRCPGGRPRHPEECCTVQPNAAENGPRIGRKTGTL